MCQRFPAAARQSLHRTRVVVPHRVATLLAADPQCIADAVQAYYTRDALDLKVRGDCSPVTPFAHALTHSRTHALTHSRTYSRTHALTHLRTDRRPCLLHVMRFFCVSPMSWLRLAAGCHPLHRVPSVAISAHCGDAHTLPLRSAASTKVGVYHAIAPAFTLPAMYKHSPPCCHHLPHHHVCTPSH